MSERPAICLRGIGKRYLLFGSRLDAVLEALGFSWLRSGQRQRARQFWALRGINLTLPRGARIGIIGRNGAGKSTLLKLITGNIEPTEGQIEVDGEVQALLQAGTGMHPDFTGYQNIEAALTYQGLSAQEIRDAVADIVDFTELGPFLDQPFKSYSTGMQARLAFATATVVRPDILIIDEVLGVGDGYFLSKSTERVQKLIDTGATVLLVSHSMEQIIRFCEQTIWMDRGQIVRQGDTLEVVKEYERYLRLLDERRIKANNHRRRDNPTGARQDEDRFTDSFHLRFRAVAGSRLQVGDIVLLENDRQQEVLHVGGPQDSAPGNSAVVCVEGNAWSSPQSSDGHVYRELSGASKDAGGEAVFSLYLFDASVDYAFDIEYRLEGGPANMQVLRAGIEMAVAQLPPGPGWQRLRVSCIAEKQNGTPAPGDLRPPAQTLKHWPGLGGLMIDSLRLFGADGKEQALFPFGSPLSVEVRLRAEQAGTFPFSPALTIYRRSDGLCVTQQVGHQARLTLAAGEQATACLHLGPLQLGNGEYMFSVALFREFDLMQVEAPERYDLVDRSVEFQVYGREPGRRGVFQHPGEWQLVRPGKLKSA
jgi:lipopolysaccharide transport system ATP-binding protein